MILSKVKYTYKYVFASIEKINKILMKKNNNNAIYITQRMLTNRKFLKRRKKLH